MATVEKPGLWSFATLLLPDKPQGSYQTIGLLLKIAGWVRLVIAALAILVGGIALIMLGFMGAVGGIATRFMPFDPVMGGFGAWFFVVALVALVLIVAVSVGLLYWTSWVYAKWVGKHPKALQYVFVYGVVTIALAALGALGALGGNPSSLLDIGMLVIGILLVVESRKPEIQDIGAPVPEQTAAWKEVE